MISALDPAQLDEEMDYGSAEEAEGLVLEQPVKM
jgi:hypothetical protein